MKKYIIIEGSVNGAFSDISFDSDSIEKVGYDRETHSTHIISKNNGKIKFGSRKHWEMSLSNAMEKTIATHIESLAF